MKNKFAKEDFKMEMLPTNRKQLVLFALKNRFKLFLAIGLLFLLFSLPWVALSIIGDILLISSPDEYAFSIIITSHIFFVLYSYAMLVPISGAMRILRQLSWGEGIFFKEMFLGGVKSNYGPNALYLTISLTLYSLSYFVATFLGSSLLLLIPLFICYILVLPLLFIIYAQNNVYSMSFGQNIKNSLFFYIKKWPFIMLFSLLFLWPNIFFFINAGLIIKYILMVSLITFYYPILIFVWINYLNHLFDIFINSKDYKSQINRGLYKPEE